MLDISDTIKAKSDQLNADDLAHPIIVQITKVTKGSADQPVIIHITGGHMPWKPSKTSRRVLANLWGTDAHEWVGRYVELYRDPTVTWAGQAVGGVRVSRLSHIAQKTALNLAVSKGKKKRHNIAPLTDRDIREAMGGASEPTARLDAFIVEQGLTMAAVEAWIQREWGKPAPTDPADRADFAAFLASKPEVIEAIRMLTDPDDDVPPNLDQRHRGDEE